MSESTLESYWREDGILVYRAKDTSPATVEKWQQESLVLLDKTDEYLIVIEKGDVGFSAYSPDVWGCVATGDTIEETAQLMQDTLYRHIDNLLEDGEPIPLPRGLEAYHEALEESEGEEYFLTYIPLPFVLA